jgi:hypothetical protein
MRRIGAELLGIHAALLIQHGIAEKSGGQRVGPAVAFGQQISGYLLDEEAGRTADRG